MRRREFIALMGGAAAAWPLSTRAQQTMPVVGFLCLSSPEAFRPRLMAFRKGLVETGFVEDRNVDIEYRWANDDARRLPQLAAELVQQNVKVIATAGGPAPALAAKALTSSIPIVFATPGSDPIETGLVTSLNRPGANVTGVGYSLSGVSGKQIEFLHEVVPPAESGEFVLVPKISKIRKPRAIKKAVKEQKLFRTPRLRAALVMSVVIDERPFRIKRDGVVILWMSGVGSG